MDKNAQKKARIQYIDLFRSIGIILMIMGHIGLGQTFSKWIHGFHMPMFFFASGFFYRTPLNIGDLEKVIKHKCKTLLIPYFVFASFHIILDQYLNGIDSSKLQLLFYNTNSGGLPIAGALWFLTALFICEVIYYLLDFYLGHSVFLHFIILILSLVGCSLRYFSPSRTPLGISAAFVGLGFFHIARVMKHSSNDSLRLGLLNLQLLPSIILLVVFSVITLLNGECNLRTQEYGNILVFWISSLGIIISLWNICKITLMHHHGMLINHICVIGRDSIIYLSLNQLAISVSEHFLSKILLLPLIANIIIVFIMTFFLLEIARRIITGTPLKIIIGKPIFKSNR